MNNNLPAKSEFLIYRTDDGEVKLDVRLEDETIWLTQQMMADLFRTTQQNISQHIRNIIAEGELSNDSVVKSFFAAAVDGKQCETNSPKVAVSKRNNSAQPIR